MDLLCEVYGKKALAPNFTPGGDFRRQDGERRQKTIVEVSGNQKSRAKMLQPKRTKYRRPQKGRCSVRSTRKSVGVWKLLALRALQLIG